MKKGLLLLLLMVQVLLAAGQTAAPADDWQTKFFEVPDLALPLLVAAAVRNSHTLEATKAEKAITQEDIHIARKAILSSILFSNNFGYGNIANATVADQTIPSALTSTSSKHYSTSINLNLPLDRLASRRNQINRQQLQLQRFEHLEQAQEDAIRQRVIDLYQAVLLDRKVLGLRQQSHQNAEVNYQLAEKQFRDGEASLAEVSQLNDRYLNAAIEQENAASKYATAFMLLEDMVGDKISEIMTRK